MDLKRISTRSALTPPEVEPAQAHITPMKTSTIFGSMGQAALSTVAKPEVVATHIVWKAPSQSACPKEGAKPWARVTVARKRVKNRSDAT